MRSGNFLKITPDKDECSPELVAALLDAGVQGSAVFAECDREEELLLGGVAEQEGALGLALEQVLRLIAIHLTPVEAAIRDLLQIGNQAVHEIDLRVHGHVATSKCGIA